MTRNELIDYIRYEHGSKLRGDRRLEDCSTEQLRAAAKNMAKRKHISNSIKPVKKIEQLSLFSLIET